MIRHGLEQLKANGKKGVSMALVLCISAFFMAFAAAILYTAGVVTAQSTHRLEEERCYRLAKSYADVLGRELTRYQNKGDTAAAGSFYAFPISFWTENAIWNTTPIIRILPSISMCWIPQI